MAYLQRLSNKLFHSHIPLWSSFCYLTPKPSSPSLFLFPLGHVSKPIWIQKKNWKYTTSPLFLFSCSNQPKRVHTISEILRNKQNVVSIGISATFSHSFSKKKKKHREHSIFTVQHDMQKANGFYKWRQSHNIYYFFFIFTLQPNFPHSIHIHFSYKATSRNIITVCPLHFLSYADMSPHHLLN